MPEASGVSAQISELDLALQVSSILMALQTQLRFWTQADIQQSITRLAIRNGDTYFPVEL